MNSSPTITQTRSLNSEGGKQTGLWRTTVLLLLFVSNVFDPGGTFGTKYVAFFLVVLFSLWTVKHLGLSAGEAAAGLFVFVAWPVWELLYGAARQGDMKVAVTQVTPFLHVLPLALLLPTFNRRTPLRLFYGCLFSLAILVLVSFGSVRSTLFLVPTSVY